jgi:hypothetical protein
LLIQLYTTRPQLNKKYNITFKLTQFPDEFSNQTLNTCVEKLDDVTIEYDLRKPFREIIDIKKAAPKSGFLSDSKRWCPQVDKYRTAILASI